MNQDRDKDHDREAAEDGHAREEGERNRQELDTVPEPGTDPLHEGP